MAGRPRLEGWEPRYLEHYREWGAKARAARAAGVSATTVQDRMRTNAAFRRDVAEAREEFLDHLEEDLVKLGRVHHNVIGILARLKADRPERYVEKHLMGVMVHELPDDTSQLLETMLAHAMPSTRRRLQAALSPAPPPLGDSGD